MYGKRTHAARQRIAALLLGVIGLLVPTVNLCADVVILKDGRQVQGLVSLGPKGVCVQRPKGKLDYYALQDVQEIYKGAVKTDGKQVEEEPEKKSRPRLPLFLPRKPAATQESDDGEPDIDAPAAKRLTILVTIVGAAAALGSLAHAVGHLMIMINAFRNSTLQGLLCLFFGFFYTPYYAIAEYDAHRRKLARFLFFGGPFLVFVGPLLMFSLKARM